MAPIPHTPHLPINWKCKPCYCDTTHIIACLNRRKPGWNGYVTEILLKTLNPSQNNYNCCIDKMSVVSRMPISRGCRTYYITVIWNQGVHTNYKAYKKQHSRNPFDDGTIETGDKLIGKITEEIGRGRLWSMPSPYGRPWIPRPASTNYKSCKTQH